MSIIEKFASVEFVPDNRIPESDRHYCEIQQAAYDAARAGLQSLDKVWCEIVARQQDIYNGIAETVHDKLRYIAVAGLRHDCIMETLENTHQEFIDCLTRYFNEKYKVTLSTDQIKKALLPLHPDRFWHDTQAAKTYHENLRSLRIDYQSILDQIFIQLDGRTFDERALSELKETCHTAVWDSYNHKPKYILKQDTIQFSYGCTYSKWFSNEHWQLTDSLKSVLRGVAYFETGCFDCLPGAFPKLLGWGDLESPLYEFPSCRKIQRLKLFKNNRTDIKFASKAFASQFVSEYLETIC